jgi:hypothetical protein
MSLQGKGPRGFAETHFGKAELGNRARTARLVDLAERFARHPGGTLPEKLKSPAALKAAYRLMERKEVTHSAVLQPHRQETLENIAQHDGPVLVIHDATELDYNGLRSLQGLGQIGNGKRRGYLCQNSLAVDPQQREVLGLVNQVLYRRPKAPKQQTKQQGQKRQDRESLLWLRGVAGLPADPRWVDVCDRGADTMEFLECEAHSGRRFVIRSHHNRQIQPEHEGALRRRPLQSFIRGQKSQGTREVKVSAGEERKARTAVVHVAFAPLRIIPPKQKRGNHGDQPLALWVVRVWEPDPPAGEEPLEWILLTNEPLESCADACRVVQWYECRWIVEEYHKAMKTGCNIEDLQFTHETRLQPMIALLSVVALTLLRLRDASRRPDAQTRLATEVVDREYVEVLNAWRYRRVDTQMSIHAFFYALARLGGHQNRKNDKLPGWLVLWRGWCELQAMVNGALAIRRAKLG